ncbi:MAG: helix-turn-helix transcriptional regulator [Bacillota bacterium]
MLFRERLRDLRTTYLPMKQTELAEKLDCGSTTISSYENGRNEPSIDILCKMSVVFNVSVDYLVGKTDVREIPNFTRDHRELIHIFDELNEVNKNTLIAQLRWLYYQQTSAEASSELPSEVSAKAISEETPKKNFVDPFKTDPPPRKSKPLTAAQKRVHPFDTTFEDD